MGIYIQIFLMLPFFYCLILAASISYTANQQVHLVC